MQPHILVVEDEEAIAIMLRFNLEKEGFKVTCKEDGEEGFHAALEHRPDIILLDWMLPSMTGVEVCREIRAEKETRAIPVIMLTARGEEDDRLAGLNSGADDYVVKPFSPKELIARIRAVLRRTNAALTEEKLEYADIKIDMSSHTVKAHDQVIPLGPTEFKLLTHFVTKPERVFSRDQLLDAVWGNDVYVEVRTVDVHIRRLRKALEDTKPGMEDYIKTIRSVGYMLKDPSKDD